MNEIQRILNYHIQTKHDFNRFSRSLGYMDWQNQPNPFRRFVGSNIISLPLSNSPLVNSERNLPTYNDIFQKQKNIPVPVTISSLSKFFELALGLTAWKKAGQTKWALRSNPSSGNLHPTEGYILLPPIENLPAGLYHYAPKEHALELRAEFSLELMHPVLQPFPVDAFFVGFSSIHWREAWKYGERAFRYCNHDIGHALGSTRIAAASLGWNMVLLDGTSQLTIAKLLGTDRTQEFSEGEFEHADCLAVVWPNYYQGFKTQNHSKNFVFVPTCLNSTAVRTLVDSGLWHGQANQLSQQHAVDWEIITEAAQVSIKKTEDSSTYFHTTVCTSQGDGAHNLTESSPLLAKTEPSAEQIIRQRRSAVDFDGMTSLSSSAFFGMFSKLLPSSNSVFSNNNVDATQSVKQNVEKVSVAIITPGFDPLVRTKDIAESVTFKGQSSGDDEFIISDKVIPWDVWPYPTASIHLLIFAHRIIGLNPGMYFLMRDHDVEKMESIRKVFKSDFLWQKIPNHHNLPLYLLQEGDFTTAAKQLSCNQDIAGDGVFSVAMFAEFKPLLQRGAWWYPRMFWEAGLVGQMLYLEAEALALRATGIGCFFDDPVHNFVGMKGVNEQFYDPKRGALGLEHDQNYFLQSIYHLAVGGYIEDKRISTLPPYHHLEPLK